MSTSQPSLFEGGQSQQPLAQRLRPAELGDFVGQDHFLTPTFRQLLDLDSWSGFIFWGPPGTGKTTLAMLIASLTKRPFVSLSAVVAGVKDIREVLEASKSEFRVGRPSHILFIDEVHRLNKSQQDVLLPFLEEGSVRFIGATTENPSFEINNAIASRCVVYHFNPLNPEQIRQVLKRAVGNRAIEDAVLEKISTACLGDARRALNLLEQLLISVAEHSRITVENFDELAHSQAIYYDKKSESHYDTISAFIKSIRGSDPDAAIYYLARMLEGGEDPLFIARRLVILSSEDIGNANPMALVMATNAFQAVHQVGMPEARIILAQAVTYLACSEKSNRAYMAINQAQEVVKQSGSLAIPMHLRNAPTKLMKEWGYGKGYDYPHNHEKGWVKAQYLPEEIRDRKFYIPSDIGTEKRLKEFLAARGKADLKHS